MVRRFFRCACTFLGITVSLWGWEAGSWFNRTLPESPGTQDTLRFVVIGDRTGSGPDSWSVFDRAVRDVNQGRPAFAVAIGDLIEGASDRRILREQWIEAKRHTDSLCVPLVLVPGNHDIPNPQGYAVWNATAGSTYFSFDNSGCHFLILNTEETHGTGEPAFGSQQLAFAETDIRRNRAARRIFVLMHQPVWMTNGAHRSQWARLDSLLPDGRTTVVAGHLHAMGLRRENGMEFVLQGATGGKLRLDRNPGLGFVHHTTWIAVEDETDHLFFLEAGGEAVPETIALGAYDLYLKGMQLFRKMPGDL